jgi:chromate transport protein ChrA
MSDDAPKGRVNEVFSAFLKLGLTSFGGPIAHLGYFRDELVVRRRWLDESAYADLVALCQFLPGPASSQVGFSLGVLRGNGLLGGFAAWFAFTMPSAVILFAFAMSAAAFTGPVAEGFLHGLKLVAVAVVAQAIWGDVANPDARPGARRHRAGRDCDRRTVRWIVWADRSDRARGVRGALALPGRGRAGFRPSKFSGPAAGS